METEAATTGWIWWAGLAAVLLLVVVTLRKTGFRLGAEAFGAKPEVEGKGGAADPAAKPDPSPPAAANPAAPPPPPPGNTQVRGRDNIVVGGNATGTFVTGRGNRVGGERERG